MATEPQRVPDAFMVFLRERRDELNRRFAARSHLAGGLDGEAFLQHLVNTLGPIVNAVSAVLPECTRSVASELYDLWLELFAARAVGPQAASPAIQRVWTDILPHIPKLMSRNAALVAGTLSNVAFNVAQTDGGRSDFWLSEMRSVAGECDSVVKLRSLAAVLAWRAGMVHYRSAAIESATALPLSLALSALGLPADTSLESLQQMFDHLKQSPWHRLESALEAAGSTHSSRFQIVYTIGDFRGFGGQFLRPPLVASRREDLFVTDGHSTWQLLADCYGSLLYRLGGSAAFPKTQRNSGAVSESISIDRHAFSELAEAASVARTQATIAVTYRDSHRILILAKS
ncbi:MAG: hypothetical protein ABI619_00775 [Betaproteobacteria bacterium]